MNKGKERRVKLAIAGEGPAKPLEFLEKALNQVTLPVCMPIRRPWNMDSAFGRNCVGSALGSDIFPEGFRPICLVSRDIAASYMDLAKQGNRMHGIVVITGTEHESQWIA